MCCQVLRDWQFQGGSDRRQQAQGGHGAGGRRYRQLQAGEPYHVRVGDPRQTAGRGDLQPGQRALGLLHQPVSPLRM